MHEDDATATGRPDPAGDLRRPTGAPPLYAQDGKGYEATVHAHYFIGGNDWLVTEYDPEEDRAFGWACLNGDRQNAELGYVFIWELAEVRVPLNITLNAATGDEVTRPYGHVKVEYDTGWPEGLTLQAGIDLLDGRHSTPCATIWPDRDEHVSQQQYDYDQSFLSGSGEHDSDSYIAYLNRDR